MDNIKYKYYKNGNIKSISEKSNDTHHEIRKEYYEDGTIKSMRNYVNGLLDGPMVVYNKSKKITDYKIYKNNVLVKDCLHPDKNEIIKIINRTSIYINDKLLKDDEYFTNKNIIDDIAYLIAVKANIDNIHIENNIKNKIIVIRLLFYYLEHKQVVKFVVANNKFRKTVLDKIEEFTEYLKNKNNDFVAFLEDYKKKISN